MGGKPAMLGLLKRKSKSVKRFFRAQPNKAAIAQFHIGLVGVGIAAAQAAVQAVAGNHHIGAVLGGNGLVVLHIGLEHQLYAQRDAAVLQDIEQPLAANAAKAMAARAHTAPLEKHFDIVPMVERVANQLGADRVGHLQIAECLV